MKLGKKFTSHSIKNNTSVNKSSTKKNLFTCKGQGNQMLKFKIYKKNWRLTSNCGKTAILHVLIQYFNEYIKAVTLGLVFIYSTFIICSICHMETLHMRRVI